MTSTSTVSKPASTRQIDYLRSLLSNREIDAATFELDFTTLSSREASGAIDYLKAQPRRRTESVFVTAKASPDPITVGVYRDVDMIVRVYPARQDRTRLLAKRFEHGEWIYLGLASRFVCAAQKLPLKDVRQFGLDFGVCAICGAELTDPTSVQRGIGPVCERNYR